MPQNKKRPSIRVYVFLSVGLSILACVVLLSYILQSNMLDMLGQSEEQIMHLQNEIVSEAINTHKEVTRAAAQEWAFRERTHRFIMGENPGYMESNWMESSQVQTYQLNFIVITDTSGKTLGAQFYDNKSQKSLSVPDGLMVMLSKMSESLPKSYEQQASVYEMGRDGFSFYDGTLYYICAMPILLNGQGGEPSGFLFLGIMYDDFIMQQLSNKSEMNFSIIDANSPEIRNLDINADPGGSITMNTENNIVLYQPFFDFYGHNTGAFKIEKSRTLYQNSLQLIHSTGSLLQIILLLGGVMLLFLIEWLLMRPLNRLGIEVQSVATLSSSVDTSHYDNSREFYTLSSHINDMLRRLKESKLIAQETVTSLGVLQNILNSMDGFVYVTDVDTNEILFINKPMKEHYGLLGDVEGQLCWQCLQSGLDKECEFCPKKHLRNDPDTPFIWEEQSTATGRYYKNVDCMIEWWGKKKVHMQHSTDITYIKQAKAELQKRLEQEQFMSTISQSFISNEDIDSLVKGALKIIGEFLDAGRIYLIVYDEESELLVYKNDWQYAKPGTHCIDNRIRTFKPGVLIYDKMMSHSVLAVNNLDEESAYQIGQMEDVRSYLAVPVYVSGKFWGALKIDYCTETHNWSDSDIHLSKLFAGVLSGVLARQIVGERLYNTNQIMHTILENAPIGIYWKNLNGCYMGCNAYFEDFMGLTEDEITGKNAFDIYPEEIARVHVKGDDRVLNSELGRITYDAPLSNKHKEIRWIHINKALIYDEKNELLCILSIFEDVTDQKKLNEKLIEAKDAAEQASRSKSDFLSRMSHEMRTPMNAIIGMTSIAKSTANPEKKEYCLDKIDNASKHLLGVINDVLDMSKIEANKFELSSGKIELEKMLIEIINVVNFRADEKKQTITVNMHKSVPPFIIGDELRLSQVITNLLTNAIKFAPDNGRISLALDKVQETKDAVTLRIEVSDNGIGISEEQQARLFTSFEQADGSISRKYGGTGLGLAISKNIIEMMEGQIWVESQLGQGSKFIFTIKAKKSGSSPTNILATGINRNNIRILAVDDSPDIREFFLSVMDSLDLPCDVAADGIEALKKLRGSRENPYNIIFIDWKMPSINGIELTRRIKRFVDHNTVVIMISVSEWSEIEKEALTAGVSRFIPKPLFPSVLVNTINEVMGVAPKEDTNIQKTSSHKLKNHTILLAEDVDINREIIMALLEDEGVLIECAEDGTVAVSMFTKEPDRYSLILMDIHMPVMDGYEATRAIRSLDMDAAKNIPIIAMTANVFQEDIEECFAAGMNGHIGKPVNQDELIEKLSQHLQSAEDKGDVFPDSPVMTEKKNESLDYDAFFPIIDIRDGLGRLLNNKHLYFNLLKNFKGRQLTDELIKNIKEKNFANTEQTAHALKGAAINLGLVQLAGLAANIEAQAKRKAESVQLIEPLDEAVSAIANSIGMLLEREEAN